MDRYLEIQYTPSLRRIKASNRAWIWAKTIDSWAAR